MILPPPPPEFPPNWESYYSAPSPQWSNDPPYAEWGIPYDSQASDVGNHCDYGNDAPFYPPTNQPANPPSEELSLESLIQLASTDNPSPSSPLSGELSLVTNTDETGIPSPSSPPTPPSLSLDSLIQLAYTGNPSPPSLSLDSLIQLAYTGDPSPPSEEVSLDSLIQLASTDEPLGPTLPPLTNEPVMRPVTTFAQIARFSPSVTYIRLEAGQWASDILKAPDLFVMNGVLLQGGCGTGKSTMLCQGEGPLIFTAPTQVIVEQIAEKDERFQLVIEGVEPNVKEYQRFATTYDSLWKICEKATEAGLNPYAIPLVCDEVQHLSSDGYKAPQLNAFMLKLRRFQQVIFASATILPFVPYFETLPIITINRDELQTRWGYVTGSETALIERELNKGFIVQFHLDDKRLAETYRQAFTKKGFRVCVITADTKRELMEAGLSDKRLPEADLYINTSVFNDGLSVHDTKRAYVSIVSKKSAINNGPFEIVQYSYRFRDSRPDFVYVCRKDDEFDEESTFTRNTYQFIYKQKLLLAEKTAALWNWQTQQERLWAKSANPHEAKHLSETADYLEKRYGDNCLVIWNEEADCFEPNLLAIGHAVYSQLRKAAYRSRNVMDLWLSEFNFAYQGIEHIEERTATDDDIIKTSSNISKADRETMRSHIAQFNDFDEVRKAASIKPADLIGSYSEAEEMCLIGTYATWQREQEEAGEEASREAYKAAIKEVVKGQEVKKKAAENLRELTYALCAEGRQLDEAFVLARESLKKSTLTTNAITRLKDRAKLSNIAEGARNERLNLQFDSKFIQEVLSCVTLNEPLVRAKVNAAFERGFTHSEKARSQFTVEVEKKQPTEEDFKKAKKGQWRKRRQLLGDFFEFERGKRTINGKRVNVSIPVKRRF